LAILAATASGASGLRDEERRSPRFWIARGAAAKGRQGLDALHVIAHGAPGRVRFTSDDWTAATLAERRTIGSSLWLTIKFVSVGDVLITAAC